MRVTGRSISHIRSILRHQEYNWSSRSFVVKRIHSVDERLGFVYKPFNNVEIHKKGSLPGFYGISRALSAVAERIKGGPLVEYEQRIAAGELSEGDSCQIGTINKIQKLYEELVEKADQCKLDRYASFQKPSRYRVKEETVGKGVGVILDSVGAPYLQQNLESLNLDGRLFIIGFMGGAKTEVDLKILLAMRLTVQAVGLRYRTLENKAAIVNKVEKNVWPAIITGKVRPVVYKEFPLSEATEAHQLLESSKHIGKILLLP